MAKDIFGNVIKPIKFEGFGISQQKENIRQPVGSSQKSKVFDGQNGKCYRCKEKLKLSHTEYHHVKFVSKGGKSKTDNLVALCANCHSEIHKDEKAKEQDKKNGRNNNSSGSTFVNPLTGKKEKSNNLWKF